MNLTTGATPMLRTVVILDLLKERLGSDYKTAQAFGKRPSHVSEIRRQGLVLNDEFGLKAAEILGMPEEFILLSLAAERAINSETMQHIKKLADKHKPADFDLPEQETLNLTGTDKN